MLFRKSRELKNKDITTTNSWVLRVTPIFVAYSGASEMFGVEDPGDLRVGSVEVVEEATIQNIP